MMSARGGRRAEIGDEVPGQLPGFPQIPARRDSPEQPEVPPEMRLIEVPRPRSRRRRPIAFRGPPAHEARAGNALAEPAASVRIRAAPGRVGSSADSSSPPSRQSRQVAPGRRPRARSTAVPILRSKATRADARARCRRRMATRVPEPCASASCSGSVRSSSGGSSPRAQERSSSSPPPTRSHAESASGRNRTPTRSTEPVALISIARRLGPTRRAKGCLRVPAPSRHSNGSPRLKISSPRPSGMTR